VPEGLKTNELGLKPVNYIDCLHFLLFSLCSFFLLLSNLLYSVLTLFLVLALVLLYLNIYIESPSSLLA
jgi:hypothetical protein